MYLSEKLKCMWHGAIIIPINGLIILKCLKRILNL